LRCGGGGSWRVAVTGPSDYRRCVLPNRRASCASGEAFKPDTVACDAELGTLANRADGERQHVAAIGMERSIRIVARRDQFAAQAEHRSGPVRGDSFGVTTVRASERSVERSLREWFLAINVGNDLPPKLVYFQSPERRQSAGAFR